MHELLTMVPAPRSLIARGIRRGVLVALPLNNAFPSCRVTRCASLRCVQVDGTCSRVDSGRQGDTPPPPQWIRTHLRLLPQGLAQVGLPPVTLLVMLPVIVSRTCPWHSGSPWGGHCRIPWGCN